MTGPWLLNHEGSVDSDIAFESSSWKPLFLKVLDWVRASPESEDGPTQADKAAVASYDKALADYQSDVKKKEAAAAAAQKGSKKRPPPPAVPATASYTKAVGRLEVRTVLRAVAAVIKADPRLALPHTSLAIDVPSDPAEVAKAILEAEVLPLPAKKVRTANNHILPCQNSQVPLFVSTTDRRRPRPRRERRRPRPRPRPGSKKPSQSRSTPSLASPSSPTRPCPSPR